MVAGGFPLFAVLIIEFVGEVVIFFRVVAEVVFGRHEHIIVFVFFIPIVVIVGEVGFFEHQLFFDVMIDHIGLVGIFKQTEPPRWFFA